MADPEENRSARSEDGGGRGPDGHGTAGYVFEQFRVERGCLGYVVADPGTRLAAMVDPEVEMVEPMLDFVFEHGLKPFYVVDTHTHADHLSGVRKVKKKTIAKIVMHENAPAPRWISGSRTGTGCGWAKSCT